MGKRSTTKGKVFERAIANQLRERWSHALIRRSSQGERADEADVFAEGTPQLERLWLELQDSKAPTPLMKLLQAEGDIAAVMMRGRRERLPVVIWHRIREHTIQATTRLYVLDLLRGASPIRRSEEVVTIELGAFLDIVKGIAA